MKSAGRKPWPTTAPTATVRSRGPSTVPARSDTVLVTTTEFDSAGQAYKTIDPAGREDRQEFDDAGPRDQEHPELPGRRGQRLVSRTKT